MGKRLISFLVFILCFNFTFAQTQQGFSFGGLGFDLSNFSTIYAKVYRIVAIKITNIYFPTSQNSQLMNKPEEIAKLEGFANIETNQNQNIIIANQNLEQQITNQYNQNGQGYNKDSFFPDKTSPYTGPTGTIGIDSDCALPMGPIAYNVGGENGNGVRCDAKIVFVGYNQDFSKIPSGVMGAGYINTITEKNENISGASSKSCKIGGAARAYGEKCFSDYSMSPNSSATSYIDKQILHWKQQGVAKGQKCVPIYVDNCDSIGANAYENVLKHISEFNKSNQNGGVKLKIFLANNFFDKSCNAGKNLMNNSDVIGGVIEEIPVEKVKLIQAMRSNPGQILLFLAGSGAKGPTGYKNNNLKIIENLKTPNSAYSYDSGKEYSIIHNCTYNPTPTPNPYSP
jgi:hypothetical protein